jgi:hypothetical protein
MPVAAIQGIKVPSGSIVSLDPFLEEPSGFDDLGDVDLDELPHGVKHGAGNVWRIVWQPLCHTTSRSRQHS